jgi:hypothetical protein
MSPATFARRTVGALFLAFAAVLLSACRDATGPRNDLANAVRVWGERGPANYDVTMRLSCFCIDEGPVTVTVRDRAVVARTVTATGQPLDPRFADQFPSVDGLFEVIERARRDRYDVTAEYDRELGYPTRISASQNIPDAGFAYYVTSFRETTPVK